MNGNTKTPHLYSAGLRFVIGVSFLTLFHFGALAEGSAPVLPEPAVLTSEPASLSLFGGGSDQLDILFGDEEQNGFSFVSSDPETALADAHGVVIALRKGNCTVTCTDPDDPERVVTVPVEVTSDRPKPEIPKSLAGLCYRQKEKISAADRKKIERYVSSLKEKSALGTASEGEKIALAALGYLGHEYGSKNPGRLDCSMLLFFSAFDTGRILPRRSDWQAEALESYAVEPDAVEPGDFLLLAAYEGDSCRCDGPCTRYKRIHHAAVYLGFINGEHWVVEASSRVGKVVIRRWSGENSHAGYELVLIARPCEVSPG